jgi:hypothetical protein
LWSATIWLSLQTTLFACPVCFQIEDGQAAAGVRSAVFVLMGVTVVVLGAMGSYLFSTGLWKSVPGVDRALDQATPGTEAHKPVENRYDPL